MQPTFEKKVIVYGLSIAILAGLTFVIGQILVENGNKVLGLSKQQNNQTSIPHNAKGHESHQVIIFQNSSDGLKYTGMVTFSLSKPADVISFEEITDGQHLQTQPKRFGKSETKNLYPAHF